MSEDNGRQNSGGSRRGWEVALLTAVAIGAVFSAAAIGWLVGAIQGESGAYHRQFLDERAVLDPILNGDAAFAEVTVQEYSGGGAYLLGAVPTQQDQARLHEAVGRAVGTLRSGFVMQGISVSD